MGFQLSMELLLFIYGRTTWQARSLFRNQGLKLSPLQWEVQSLTTGLVERSPSSKLKSIAQVALDILISCVQTKRKLVYDLSIQ